MWVSRDIVVVKLAVRSMLNSRHRWEARFCKLLSQSCHTTYPLPIKEFESLENPVSVGHRRRVAVMLSHHTYFAHGYPGSPVKSDPIAACVESAQIAVECSETINRCSAVIDLRQPCCIFLIDIREKKVGQK